MPPGPILLIWARSTPPQTSPEQSGLVLYVIKSVINGQLARPVEAPGRHRRPPGALALLAGVSPVAEGAHGRVARALEGEASPLRLAGRSNRIRPPGQTHPPPTSLREIGGDYR